MRNIDFNKYQSALIIGNGFDLSLGLSTSYMDFVNSDEFQILLNMQNQLAIYLKVNAELQNWIDIENELKLYSKNEDNAKFKTEYEALCKQLVVYINNAMVGNGNYEVSFTKIGRKWYCNVPGFPKELFEHTLMVGGASNYLEYYSRGENEIVATIRIAKEWEDKFYCGVRLYKVSSTLTGGAFYKDPSGNFGEELWLCPVTLFLLGKYPKLIFIYKINKNYLHCPICIE